MSTISAISSSAISPLDAASTTATATAAPATGQQALGIDDFMKLLATQFQQQDPLKPMDDTAFIAQTAQFTSLQQTNTLVQQMTQMSASQNISAANSYLGCQVTVDAGNGQTASGIVSAVDASGSAPQLILNGQSYPLSAVLLVQPGSASLTNPTTQSPTSGS